MRSCILSELQERVWAIRDVIQKLEDIKDEIIGYFENSPDADSVWISDTKEAYFSIVASWQMLDACLNAGEEEKAENAFSSRNFLDIARSHLGQSASELRALGEKKALELEERWIETHDMCRELISSELEQFIQKESTPLDKRVIKISDSEYHLPCAICGEIAVKIDTGIYEYDNEEYVIYIGICVRSYFAMDYAKRIFDALEDDNLAEFHSIMKEDLEDGADAYCPDCDKIYCHDHYNPREVWDAGFYDCTYGTCPDGHERIIYD